MRDRVALIAGSSRGIGLAIAREFLREGARVCLSGRHSATLARANQALRGEAPPDRIQLYVGDLTQNAEIRRCLRTVQRRWGRVDIAVANIGSGRGTAFEESDEQDWQGALRQNLLGGMALARAVLPLMKAQRGGVLCFVSSIAGLEAIAAPVPYVVAKAGVVAASKRLAREYAPFHIRVNVVAPGNIYATGGTWDMKQRADSRGVLAYLRRSVPMGRFGTPEEIAACVVFLCSARASFVTGACWVADGGQTQGF